MTQDVGLLTVRECAERLGLSSETVRGWIWRGQCPFAYYKLGKRVVFRTADVDAWFESQRVPSANEVKRVVEQGQ